MLGQLGRLGAGFGRLGGSGGAGVAAPSAPVLAWVSAETDTTPEFTIEIDDTIAEGDNVQFQYQADGGDWSSPTTVNDTISAGEDAANQIDMAMSALGDGAYEARVRVSTAAAPTTWSSWSNVVDFTIAASDDNDYAAWLSAA